MAKHRAETSGDIWFKNQRVWRTALAVGIPAAIALVAILPEVIQAVLAEMGESLPAGLRLWLAGTAALITALAATISRVMAIPGVDAWLRRWTPFGSAPKGK